MRGNSLSKNRISSSVFCPRRECEVICERSLGSSGFPSSNERSKATFKPQSSFSKVAQRQMSTPDRCPSQSPCTQRYSLEEEPIFSAAYCYHLEFLAKTIISSDFTLSLTHMLKGRHRLSSGLRHIGVSPLGFDFEDARLVFPCQTNVNFSEVISCRRKCFLSALRMKPVSPERCLEG